MIEVFVREASWKERRNRIEQRGFLSGGNALSSCGEMSMDEGEKERVTLDLSVVSVLESFWKRHCFKSRNV